MPEVAATLSFGMLGKARPDRAKLDRARFRIAILGDFSGRAARGEIETGAALARRRAIRFDLDTLEDVVAGFGTRLVLPLGKRRAGIEVSLASLDDLHPDELFENVELFDGLSALKRSLRSGATAERSRQQLIDWGKANGRKVKPPRKSSRGNRVPANLRLSEFQRLIGAEAPAEPAPADALIERIIGPYVQALPDPDVPALEAAADDALSDAMRLILHHPEFQSVEAQWRTLDLLAHRIETDDDLDLVLYDISAEEIAADLAAVEDLTETGLHDLLAEGTPDGRGNFSALVGLYTFEETPPHAELLGRIARLAAYLDAPFISAISPAFLDVKKQDRHPLVAEAWDGLRAMGEANHLMLATPRFLLRRPYGKRTDPVGAFAFEEFTEAEGLAGLLWGNPAAAVAILLAQSFRQNGPSLKLGSVMTLGQMPYHFVLDQYGDQVALPCTERNMTQTKAKSVIERGYCPLLTVKGRDEVRLAAFVSLAGRIVLGPWSKVPPPPETPPSPPLAVATAAPDPAEGGDSDLDAAGTGGDDAAGGDDLDALLADLDSEGGDGSDAAGSDDIDLDQLLAGFDDETSEGSGTDSEEMDPELAALLADL